MDTNNPAALSCSSPWDRFPFTKHITHKEMCTEGNLEYGKTVERTTCGKRVTQDKAAEQKTCAKKDAEVKNAINERAEAIRPTLRESWVEVSHPIPTGSWVEVKDPNLQDTWIDGPPSRAPSCGDDNTPLPDLQGIKGKAEFVWGWLKAMGGAIRG